MVERQLPKLDVASSSLVSRLFHASGNHCLHGSNDVRAHSRGNQRLSFWSRTQMVKGAVCKTVITSSILVGSFPLLLEFTFHPALWGHQELPSPIAA